MCKEVRKYCFSKWTWPRGALTCRHLFLDETFVCTWQEEKLSSGRVCLLLSKRSCLAVRVCVRACVCARACVRGWVCLCVRASVDQDDFDCGCGWGWAWTCVQRQRSETKVTQIFNTRRLSNDVDSSSFRPYLGIPWRYVQNDHVIIFCPYFKPALTLFEPVKFIIKYDVQKLFL